MPNDIFSLSLCPQKLVLMYAIVDVAGQQFKVEKGQEIYVHRLTGKEGDKIELKEVLLVDDGAQVLVGKPNVPDAKLIATIQSHLLGDRVVVFKKKRRKGYRVKNGHRQQFTMIKIDDIVSKTSKAAKPAAEAKKASDTPKKEAAKPKAAAKEAGPKKEAPKKDTESKKTAKD